MNDEERICSCASDETTTATVNASRTKTLVSVVSVKNSSASWLADRVEPWLVAFGCDLAPNVTFQCRTTATSFEVELTHSEIDPLQAEAFGERLADYLCDWATTDEIEAE